MPAETGHGGQRLCIYHPPRGGDRKGCIVYVHPFAEEMNKTRRMAALQARALAAAGWAVLQVDLLGCGDSSGDFGDATWQEWVNDVTRACDWLNRKHPASLANDGQPGNFWLWGLRSGCLLAAEAAAQLSHACNFLFWQAPSKGKSQLQQFLRLRLAADMLDRSGENTQTSLRQQLLAGQALEIGGYQLSPDLAAGLEQAVLAPPARRFEGQRLAWLEVSASPDSDFSPAQTHTMDEWRSAGYAVDAHRLAGPAFWQTSDIEENLALIALTMETLAA